MIRPLLVIGLVASLTYAARSFIPAGVTVTGSGAALAFGCLLICSLSAARVFEVIRFPHLTSYILCGLVLGPEVLGIISGRMLEDLALINGAAVGLIAFLAGCELNFRRLRSQLRAITLVSVGAMMISGLLLFAFFLWLTTRLSVTADLPLLHRAVVSLIAANVLTAFSPAVVIGLVTETRSRGPLTDLTMSAVILADLALVVTFAISSAVARSVFVSVEQTGGFGALAMHLFGSIALGTVVGAILAGYSRRFGGSGLVTIAFLFVVAEAGRAWHVNPLLAGLAAGLLVENVAAIPVSGRQLTRATAPVTLATFALFFSVVGAQLQLRAFLHVAPFALIAAVVRAGGIFAGARFGARTARVDEMMGRLVPLGLIPQAGVAFALAVLVLDGFPPWGRVVGTILLGSLVVNQLIGPILFRIALDRAGEIGADTDLDEEETGTMPEPALSPP